MASTQKTTIDSLPIELLFNILSPLSTPVLLPLAAVSHRFHAVATRLLLQRLKAAAALPQHELILECYHPSAKISTPYLHCDHLDTPGLAALEGTDDDLSLSTLAGLYSRFRPVSQDADRRPRARYPRRAPQAQRVAVAQGDGRDRGEVEGARVGIELAGLDVNLDESEVFSQLCCVTNMVKTGPKRGLFLSCVNIGDSVLRVWRHWLAARAATDAGLESDDEESADGAVLWADAEHNVGLRFRVVERAEARQPRPLLVGADDDLPVSYTLQFEELLVRTNRLLLMVERSEVQEVTTSGKAIVIASM